MNIFVQKMCSFIQANVRAHLNHFEGAAALKIPAKKKLHFPVLSMLAYQIMRKRLGMLNKALHAQFKFINVVLHACGLKKTKWFASVVLHSNWPTMTGLIQMVLGAQEGHMIILTTGVLQSSNVYVLIMTSSS